MSYKNKTYVAFASEDIHMYRLMEAWRDNEKIDFNFYDAHDLFISRDSSQRETIKRNLRERLKNAKQVVLIGTPTAKSKGGDGYSFLAHEISVIMEFNLPIVIANKSGSRNVDYANIPQPLIDNNYYSISTSFQPAIIKFALDYYTPVFQSDKSRKGPHFYNDDIYTKLGLSK
ncbi:TIR domain-containing protein [Salmonella enterica subsp. enterica]|nr:molecular chaperone Tir [Salmonella enterica subsp. enterica serovar Wien str. CFSAN000657]EDT2636398.1 molecular chaperone Tir [Salmonella enterica subsp. enterica]EEE6744665.1 molecular chaperone Tir [Salmonella enterica subsp. enterica serovar Westhampton]HAE8456758.1 molecular chaperone Tir [Salmonella enterica subsp. enterica serovar Wien]HCB4568536.1 molecular chaperone Tir [Salmonella enterica]